MSDFYDAVNHVLRVSNFQDLVGTPFHGNINAISWTRDLMGDFSEIVSKITVNGNLTVIDMEALCEIQLSEQGNSAREIILNDFNLLKAHGAAPTLNLIQCYERDDNFPFFPTDVYSFHVDRSPIPVDTFLCTYFGASSEILPNEQAEQKILVPEIRHELKKKFQGKEEEFDSFLVEHFFDLHYQAIPDARPISLGNGNLWRLAIDYPESTVPPCVHRAPRELPGEPRLLMIC